MAKEKQEKELETVTIADASVDVAVEQKGGNTVSETTQTLSAYNLIKEFENEQLKEELNNFQLYNLIDKKHYIGCMYDQLDQQKDFVSDLTTKTEYRNDDHPNQSGHDKIAHIILNNINNSR